MPKIDAPTVAEHHSRRRAALLAAAARLLAAQGVDAVTLAAVGAEAGLARSSVYQYFDSTPALLAAVVQDLAAASEARLAEAGVQATSPEELIDAFVRASLDTATDATHRSLAALESAPLPEVCREHIEALHRRQFEPLRAALVALGDPEPDLSVPLIRGLIVAASRAIGEGAPLGPVADRTLAFIHHGVRSWTPEDRFEATE